MPAPSIDVDAVSKSFGARQALHDVSLSVAGARISTLLGPNGGGKTTLFRIVSTLMRPDRGRVRVCTHDTTDDPQAVRRCIGVVFQSPSLDGKLTAGENLAYHGHIHGLRGRTLRLRIEACLDAMGVQDRARDRTETLSGGLARRVEIAKSMLPEPRILLLDEPGTGLDPTARRDLWSRLDALRQDGRVAVLLTTHLLDEAERSDRVFILDRGRLVAEGSPDELMAAVGEDVIRIEADDPHDAAKVINEQFDLDAKVVAGSIRTEATDAAAWVPRLANALGPKINTITVGRPSLEDVFVRATGHQFSGDADL